MKTNPLLIFTFTLLTFVFGASSLLADEHLDEIILETQSKPYYRSPAWFQLQRYSYNFVYAQKNNRMEQPELVRIDTKLSNAEVATLGNLIGSALNNPSMETSEWAVNCLRHLRSLNETSKTHLLSSLTSSVDADFRNTVVIMAAKYLDADMPAFQHNRLLNDLVSSERPDLIGWGLFAFADSWLHDDEASQRLLELLGYDNLFVARCALEALTRTAYLGADDARLTLEHRVDLLTQAYTDSKGPERKRFVAAIGLARFGHAPEDFADYLLGNKGDDSLVTIIAQPELLEYAFRGVTATIPHFVPESSFFRDRVHLPERVFSMEERKALANDAVWILANLSEDPFEPDTIPRSGGIRYATLIALTELNVLTPAVVEEYTKILVRGGRHLWLEENLLSNVREEGIDKNDQDLLDALVAGPNSLKTTIDRLLDDIEAAPNNDTSQYHPNNAHRLIRCLRAVAYVSPDWVDERVADYRTKEGTLFSQERWAAEAVLVGIISR